jgi:hypothetical protein
MRLVRDSKPIASLDDWATHAPPKSAGHWVDGRSAKELARAWCGAGGPAVPDEVAAALRSHPDLASLRIVELTPEARIRFDKRRGEPRNADLAGIAEDGDGKAVIHVEGKADETFGQRVQDVRESAEAIVATGATTGAADRVHDLVAALVPPASEASAGTLRYQLMTATAAALADARERGARKAVLIVHEFVSEKTTREKQAANAADLDAFVRVISAGSYALVGSGEAIGPIQVPGGPLIENPVPLYIAKAVRNVARVEP